MITGLTFNGKQAGYVTSNAVSVFRESTLWFDPDPGAGRPDLLQPVRSVLLRRRSALAGEEVDDELCEARVTENFNVIPGEHLEPPVGNRIGEDPRAAARDSMHPRRRALR